MTDLIVRVKLWGELVGSLVWDKSLNCAAFEYDSNFKKKAWSVSPLVMKIPSRGSQVFQFPQNKGNCFEGLPGLIADSLPDKFGTQIINEYFAAKGLSTDNITPLDRLCYVGTRAMGALEFEPARDLDILNDSTLLQINKLTRLAEDIFNKRAEFKANLKEQSKALNDILRIGTSAGGAKPKAIIAFNENTQEIRSGQVKAPDGFSYWLLKFDGVSYSEHDNITDIPMGIGNVEFAYHKMAMESGIQMNECRLLEDGERHHFMTKRFDRKNNGEKIHMQTLAALKHLDKDSRHSYEELFEVARKLGLGDGDAREIFRRLTFNVLALNNDDHTKNFSFLMDQDGIWKLAPAYDLCYANNPNSRWINKHQMSINQKQADISTNDLKAIAQTQGIRGFEEDIQRIQAAISHWPEIAKECGVRKNHIAEIQKAMDLQRDLG